MWLEKCWLDDRSIEAGLVKPQRLLVSSAGVTHHFRCIGEPGVFDLSCHGDKGAKQRLNQHRRLSSAVLHQGLVPPS